ncbi:uncharacterized protein [Gossypium hirsutum]|uniref:Uncharacterized protein isoform X1 n=1 Tax=Gossypium hirsutum TaxID=3635 RepID=A0ABM2YJF5_GOSHI|nr:uncharacterized protein LOC107951512 isoform X1 [Gossypium hirsutum]
MRFKLLEMLILMDILLNRSINDALVAEEKFFRSRPVYNGLADRCGVPQLAKKLNQEVDPCEGLTDDDIRTAIQRSSSIYTWLIRYILCTAFSTTSALTDWSSVQKFFRHFQTIQIYNIFSPLFVGSLASCPDKSVVYKALNFALSSEVLEFLVQNLAICLL